MYHKMSVHSLSRLYSMIKNIKFSNRRNYCNKNVLKFNERDMYENVFPDTSV